MTAALVVLAVLVAGQIVMLGAVLTRERLLRSRMRTTVIANLKSGMSFRGVLFEVDNRSLVLRNTEALGRSGDGVHIPVDGEVVIARSDVEFIQKP
jgi:small nuclear ribonucleoprotein (snRNP)-like protein